MPLGAVVWGIVAIASASSAPPAKWIGAGFDGRDISLSVVKGNAQPRLVAAESASRRKPDSIDVTDLAYDSKQNSAIIATCCEPGSGQLLKVSLSDSKDAFKPMDQGFAVDVSGPLFARADTWGTFVTRDDGPQFILEGGGVADVAVTFEPEPRILALVSSGRLRALVPTVPAPALDPAILMHWQSEADGEQAAMEVLPRQARYCRIVALPDSAIGLLAGEPDSQKPWLCIGDTLDVYKHAETRKQVLKFPAPIRHLSIDDSATFLIFTTVDGAVGWRTLDGKGGALAESGFVAADW
jgi:hypothetical protein